MREDFDKVITERPRDGARIKQPKGEKKELQRTALEDQPQREKIRLKWKKDYGNSKTFTDLLGPIKGFLEKNVGRSWNDIFSEICQVLPATGGVSLSHARDHIFQYVEMNGVDYDGNGGLILSDGTVLNRSYSSRWHLFYVCPRLGVLKKFKEESHRYRRKKRKPIYKNGNPLIQFHCHEDIWYELTLEKIDPIPSTRKTSIGKHSWWQKIEELPPKAWQDLWIQPGYMSSGNLSIKMKDNYGMLAVCVEKRQLNSREIKRYQLRSV